MWCKTQSYYWQFGDGRLIVRYDFSIFIGNSCVIAALDLYTAPLTVKTAAHLLRRATFGPTQKEIDSFTGLTAEQVVQQLIANANYNPAPPVDIDSNQSTTGHTYLDMPFNHPRDFDFGYYLRCYWLSLMTSQTAPPLQPAIIGVPTVPERKNLSLSLPMNADTLKFFARVTKGPIRESIDKRLNRLAMDYYFNNT